MPSKRQVSLTLSPAAHRAIARRMPGGRGNKSQIISQIIERYQAILRLTCIDLENDELEHLARLTDGWDLDASTAAVLPSLAESADVPEDLDVARTHLVEKLQNAGVVGRLQALEALETLQRSRGG